MRYPQNFIDDLRRQADIVKVIQDYTPLKKKGTNWMACCPFHNEKTPSFSVNPNKGFFYCFGCQKGGSVFNFVMELDGVNFPEAVRIVAEKTGIRVPKNTGGPSEDKVDEVTAIIQLNTWALEFWRDRLEGCPRAQNYLSERGVSPQTARDFQLGFATDAWEDLYFYLSTKGVDHNQIVQSGLVIKKEDGKVYDRFRERLMFPILDLRGRPIAFGGRALGTTDAAKYINSPETPAYTKSNHLFGLATTKNEIRRLGYAILVEGYLDLIVPHQAGITNMVASLGTSLTEKQVKLLSRFTRKVVINYDGDEAGLNATKKAIELFLKEDFAVKVVTLPEGLDPDSYVTKYGRKAYQDTRARAQSYLDFLVSETLSNKNLHQPHEKAEAVERVIPFVKAISNPVTKKETFRLVVDSLQITDRGVVDLLWKKLVSDSPLEKKDIQKAVAVTGVEEKFLMVLVWNADLRREIVPQLKPEDYEHFLTAPIFQSIIDVEGEGLTFDFQNLSSKLEGDQESINRVAELLMKEEGSWDAKLIRSTPTPAQELILAFRRAGIENRIRDIKTDLARAEREENKETINSLSLEQTKLEGRRRSLFR